jgi:hypothetical protein
VSTMRLPPCSSKWVSSLIVVFYAYRRGSGSYGQGEGE